MTLTYHVTLLSGRDHTLTGTGHKVRAISPEVALWEALGTHYANGGERVVKHRVCVVGEREVVVGR